MNGYCLDCQRHHDLLEAVASSKPPAFIAPYDSKARALDVANIFILGMGAGVFTSAMLHLFIAWVSQ